jgi:hypothetical protein
MTPKEKAIELVDKYLNKDINFPYIDSEDGQCIGAGYMTYNSAKQCALIAVDEILNLDIKAKNESQFIIERRIEEYWQEVNQEINNL